MKKAELILLAAAFAGFAIITLLTQGEPAQFELDILAAFRHDGAPAGPKWLLEVARSVTALGGHTVLTIVVALVASYLLLIGDRLTAAFVVFAAASGAIINTLLKVLFDRARPDVAGHLTEVFTASFPSGHAALSAVVYLTLGVLLAATHQSAAFRIYFISVATILVLLVGLSRVYLGVHYPSDVLAGWCFGIAWAAICWLGLRYLQARRSVEPPANP